MHGLVGSLFDPNEEEDIPLLYHHSFLSFFKWICSWAIPGLGMFSEAYFVFSIGNIKPLLADQYPACWSKYQVSCCNFCAPSVQWPKDGQSLPFGLVFLLFYCPCACSLTMFNLLLP